MRTAVLGGHKGILKIAVAVCVLLIAPAFTASAQPLVQSAAETEAQFSVSAGGGNFGCALVRDGSVRCWGDNTNGRLGSPPSVVAGSSEGLRVPNLAATQISAGGGHTCALKADGTVWCWGDGDFGQLGPASSTSSHEPVKVSGLDDVIQVDAGVHNTCALRRDGTVWCWGYNGNDQLRVETEQAISPVPAQVGGGLVGVTAISGGNMHYCAVLVDGSVSCWGLNRYGQADPRTPTGGGSDHVVGPAAVPSLDRVRSVSAGTASSCASLHDGTVYCWGTNTHGQLGNGTTDPQSYPVKVVGLESNGHAAVGGQHTCAVAVDEAVWCWGTGDPGVLGSDSPPYQSPVPVKVRGIAGAVTVDSAESQSCAATGEDEVWCWGRVFGGGSGGPRKVVLQDLPEGPQPGRVVRRIASLGDSYASGEGLLPGSSVRYDCGTDLHEGQYVENTTVPRGFGWLQGVDCDTVTGSTTRPDDYSDRSFVTYENLCHRQSLAYPNRIRERLGLAASDGLFVACSGAETRNIGFIVDPAPEPSHPRSPQRVAGANLQKDDLAEFAAAGEPDLITIGIGGNDAGFAGVLSECLFHECLSRDVNYGPGVLKGIDNHVYPRLIKTFEDLLSAHPSSVIVAFGYPTVVSGRSTDCDDAQGPFYNLDQRERDWAEEALLPVLNRAVEDAAKVAGVHFFPIAELTKDNDVCSDDPWINGLRGGDDIFKVIGNESFHPNQVGHEKIAEHFFATFFDGSGRLTKTQNPAKEMRSDVDKTRNPHPDGIIPVRTGNVTAHVSTVQDTQSQLLGVCVNDCVLRVRGSNFEPHVRLRLAAHSDPLDLGELVADENGTFSATVSIPDGALEPGVHTLVLSDDDGVGDINMGTTMFLVAGAPTITSLHAERLSPTSARVTWTTPGVADTHLEHGPTSELGHIDHDLTLVTHHTVTVAGLPANGAHQFRATSRNEVGGRSSADVTLPAAITDTSGGGGSVGDDEPPAPSLTVRRLAGGDRIATAIAISGATFPDSADGAVIAGAADRSFPDSLVATPLAATVNGPLLTTDGHRLDPRVRSELQRLLRPGTTVHIAGGTHSVSDTIETDLRALGYRPVRVAGVDRYATAARVARHVPAPTEIFLATGRTFPDALTAATAAAHRGGVVLLTDGPTVPPATRDYLVADPTVSRWAVGGDAASADPTARRIAGVDRYDTARRIATRLFPEASTASVATGIHHADALTGALHSALQQGPLLLTDPEQLNDYARTYLQDRRTSISNVWVYGGTAAVSAATVRQIERTLTAR